MACVVRAAVFHAFGRSHSHHRNHFLSGFGAAHHAALRQREEHRRQVPFESTVTTLANYVAVFASPATLPIFFDTFIFTVGSLAVGLPSAILLAWLLERTAIPARAWVANADSCADDDSVVVVSDRMDSIARSAHPDW